MKTLILTSLILASMNVFSMTGLKIGANAPDLEVTSTEGKKINFSKLEKDTAVVFFRGSWCPYCIKQLDSIQNEIKPKLKKNTQVIAISVDKMNVAKKMKAKQNYEFVVVSDPKANSLKAFNIVNKLDDELVKKYKASYKIDVEGDSGETHHMVAHPAVFVIKDGKIRFADVQVDYKKRTKNSAIIDSLLGER